MDKQVVKIEVEEGINIELLFQQMLMEREIMSNGTECEVEADLNGATLTTEGATNIDEMISINCPIILNAIKEDRKKILNLDATIEMNRLMKVRGEIYAVDGNDVEINPEKEAEFDKKIEEFKELNFEDPTTVINWLDSVEPYINDHELYLALPKDDYQYGSYANYIVKKLQEKGYGTPPEKIENIDDYIKSLIAYQMNDLDKYKYFAYDYTNNLIKHNVISLEEEAIEQEEVEEIKQEEISKIVTEQVVTENTVKNEIKNTEKKINQVGDKNMEKELEKLEYELKALEELKNGRLNEKNERTESFETRINNIEEKNNKLKSANNDKSNIEEKTVKLEESKSAIERLNSFIVDENIKNNSAMPLYYKALETKDKEDILKAIEAVQQLDDSHMYKKTLTETLELLSSISTPNKNSELENLEKEMAKLLKEQEEAIQKYTPMIDEKKKEIEAQKEKINKAQNVNKAQQAGETAKPVNSQDDYYDRLSKLTEEGPLFVDRDRINKEDQWLETRNAQNLGKLDTSDRTNEEINSNEDIPEIRDTLRPQPIKAIKKAGVQLLSKIRSFDFKEKLEQAIEWIKEHKIASIAIASGLFALGTAGLLNSQPEEIQNTEIPLTNQEIENTVTPEVTPAPDTIIEEKEAPVEVQEKTDEEIFADELEEALSNIMDGEVKVYRTAENAANDINARTPTPQHLDESWSNANANTFYDMNAQVLTKEQAEEIVANGGEVVARFDNNGTHIGYATVGNEETKEASGNIR